MENKVVQFAGWHNGMIDSAEGDHPFEANQPMNSCLWLENYDPNVIMQSLIKRHGIRIDNTQGFLYGDDNRANHIPLYIVPSTTYNQFLGCCQFSTTRPVDHDIMIIFVKSDDALGDQVVVMARVADEDVSTNGKYYWHEPNTLPNPIGQPLTDKLRIIGKLGSWYNYANNLLIVTTKDKDQLEFKNSYPVYVYGYEDNDNYKFILMPFNFKDVQDDMWKVRKATKYLLDNNKVEGTSLQFNDPLKFNPFKLFDGSVEGKTWQNAFGYGDAYKNRMVYWEDRTNWEGTSKVNDWIIDPTVTLPEPVESPSEQLVTEMTNSTNKNKIDVMFWQTDQLPVGHRNSTKAMMSLPYEIRNRIGDNYYCTYDQNWPTSTMNELLNDYIITIEELNYESDKWAPYCRMTFPPIQNGNTSNSVNEAGFAHTLWRDAVGLISKYNGAYRQLKAIKGKIRYTNTDEIVTVNLTPSMQTSMYRSLGQTLSNNLFLNGENMDNVILHRIMGSEGGELGRALKIPYMSYTAFLLPNYIKHNVPRYWNHGEPIRYVLTAVIDGIETEVKRGLYEIPPSYDFPTLQNPSLVLELLAPNYPQRSLYYDIPSNSLKGGNPNSIHPSYHPLTWSETFMQHITEDTHISNNLNNLHKRSGTRELFSHFYTDEENEGHEVKSGFWTPYPMWGRFPWTMFTLRLNYDSIEEALNDLPTGLTEFKLYVSGADNESGIVTRDIRGISHSPISDGYSLPLVTNSTNNRYRLVKTFIVKGREGDKVSAEKWRTFKHGYQGSAGYTETNKWLRVNVEDHSGSLSDPRQLFESRGNGLYAIPESAELEFLSLRNDEESGKWTPDFYLWDYPSVSEMLIDNVSATGDIQLWKGKGARLVIATRGATVIGGCQDEKGNEEVGKLRVSLNQNGKQSIDIFPEWNYLQVGRDTHTALVNFNDTIIAFSKEGYQKVVLNDLTKSSSWHVTNEIRGQGVNRQESVCVTPYGVCFANFKGVFITDGNENNEIGRTIQNTYLRAINQSNSHVGSWDNKKSTSVSTNMVELLYVSSKNELHVHLHSMAWTEFVLIYDFQFKNWRIHSYPVSNYNRTGTHRTLIDHPIHGKIAGKCDTYVGDLASENPFKDYVLKNNGSIFYSQFYDDMRKPSKDETPVLAKPLVGVKYLEKDITGTFVSHDIGNGQDDFILDKIMIEAYPGATDGTSSINELYDVSNPDPIFTIATRHQSNAGRVEPQIEHKYDLFSKVMRNGWKKWLTRTSPTNVGPSQGSNKIIRTRESFYYLVPFGIKFRKGVIYFSSKSLTMVRDVKLYFREYARRFYS